MNPFSHYATIELGEGEYQAVRLTPLIYNHLRPNLADILIVDYQGNTLPYFINSYEMTTSTQVERTDLALHHHFVRYGASYFDFFVYTGPHNIATTSLVVHSQSTMFARNTDIWGSHDGLVWDFITTTPLYRVGDSEQMQVNFRPVQYYNHFRLRIPNDGNNDLVPTGLTLEFSQSVASRNMFWEEYRPNFSVITEGRNTLVHLYGLNNVRVNQVFLYTDCHFRRSVLFAGNRHTELYNLSFDFTPQVFENLTLDFAGYTSFGDYLTITIQNGDDNPINIQDVRLSYFADEVVFRAGAGSVATMYFGNPAIATPPVYDIARYSQLIVNAGYPLMPITQVNIAEAPEATAPRDFIQVFNIAIVVVAVLLGVIIVAKLKGRESHGE